MSKQESFHMPEGRSLGTFKIMRRFSIKPKRSRQAFALWLAATVVSVPILAAYEYGSGLSDLSERSWSIETLLAERLAQHDAHLTALGTLIRMSPQEPSLYMQGLAKNIMSRYPRITDFAIFDLDDLTRAWDYGSADGPKLILEQSAGGLPKLKIAGETAIQPSAAPNSYEIFKLVVPRRILRLRISADALLDGEQLPAQYSVTLAFGDSVLSHRDNGRSALVNVSTVVLMSNHSQPLRLTVARDLGFAELLPSQLVLPLLALLAAVTWLVTRYLYASEERRRQEQRAALLEQDAKLAHAGRLNALGEMASGIAHELAQPLAAMLAQSQAARRALTIGRSDILERALDANIREAKRAGDILGRMRAYISGVAARLEEVPLAQALAEAVRLIETDLSQRNIKLSVTLSSEDDTVAIDVISFQQVILNLIRNAADAVAHQTSPRIALSAERERNEVLIKIADNGPGIDPSSLDRIFEPFFTTKPDGMGLGLPLSSRLIEKMDGSLSARNEGGACFIIRLPSGSST